MTTEELLDQYREMVIAWAEALERGRIRKANRIFHKRAQLSHHFRGGTPDAQRALLALLDDKNMWVRYSAATHSLEFAPDRSVPVLEQIANGPPGPARLGAEMVLSQWRDGSLRLL